MEEVLTKLKTTLDVEKIREDFPILARKVHGKPLIYFDNAATSQKPIQVIKAIQNYYEQYNANVHRSVHQLSEEATRAYEEVRGKISLFINAKTSKEVIFVRNATEAINLVAFSWGRANVEKGDEIILTEMEHHSNFVPWVILAKEKGAKLKFIPVNDNGELESGLGLEKLLTNKVKLVAFTHVSNVLGTINPVKEIIEIIKSQVPTAKILIDGAQAVPHLEVDIQDLDPDFYAFTAHKMLGPTGIGVLWGKQEILEEMSPFLGGGEMIREVSKEAVTFNDVPWKFEAGTPDVAGVIGLGAALDYLNKVRMVSIREHEKNLTSSALKELYSLESVKVYGPLEGEKRSGVISFNLGDIHAHDLASVLDESGIAIRSGHHCAQPLMKALGIAAAARISFYLYNTKEEIDIFVEELKKAKKMFKI